MGKGAQDGGAPVGRPVRVVLLDAVYQGWTEIATALGVGVSRARRLHEREGLWVVHEHGDGGGTRVWTSGRLIHKWLDQAARRSRAGGETPMRSEDDPKAT